jgi:hypothetical protein
VDSWRGHLTRRAGYILKIALDGNGRSSHFPSALAAGIERRAAVDSSGFYRFEVTCRPRVFGVDSALYRVLDSAGIVGDRFSGRTVMSASLGVGACLALTIPALAVSVGVPVFAIMVLTLGLGSIRVFADAAALG